MNQHKIQDDIIALANKKTLDESDRTLGRGLVNQLLDDLEAGTLRVVNIYDDSVTVNAWVKQGIILGFRLSETVSFNETSQFRDKDLFPLQTIKADSTIRVVPPAAGIRRGSFVDSGCILMPPAYVNVGAHIGKNTMLESLAGSCAQIGANCHISYGSVIGGVLDPIEATPVILGDFVLLGENAGVTQGTRLGKLVTVAPGTHISKATPVIDPINKVAYTSRGTAELEEESTAGITFFSVGKIIKEKDSSYGPEIPDGALIIPGVARSSHGTLKTAPTIAKYINSEADRAYALEEALR